MTQRRSFVYSPGNFTCLAEWPVCLLIDILPEDPRLSELTDLLADGMDAVADYLSRGGMTTTPAFAMMQVGEDPVRVVIHGEAQAIIDGKRTQGTRLFVETSEPHFREVMLVAGMDEQTSHEGSLMLSSGGARAGSATWRADEQATPMKPLTLAERAGTPSNRVRSVAETTGKGHAERTNTTKDEPATIAAIADPSETNPQFTVHSSFADRPRNTRSEMGGFDHLFAGPPKTVIEAASPGPETDPGPEAPHEEPADSVNDDPGRTQIAPMTTPLAELEALRDSEETPEESEPEEPEALPPEPTDERQVPAFISSFDWDPENSPPLPTTVAVRDGGSQLDSQPQPSSSYITPPDATVRKADLVPLAGTGEVIVVAFQCPQGHHSPPYATHCRVCQTPLDQRQPVQEVPRPVLGVLRLWGGGSVLLDRGVIFGRNPRLIPGLTGPEPSLVRIDDPNRDVSSQHCEVRLEDWFVTVRDLSSTNGTQVILPHRPPVALRANDPMAIEPRTRVVLANAFDFVFEVM